VYVEDGAIEQTNFDTCQLHAGGLSVRSDPAETRNNQAPKTSTPVEVMPRLVETKDPRAGDAKIRAVAHPFGSFHSRLALGGLATVRRHRDHGPHHAA
jgi:hypothetical protein